MPNLDHRSFFRFRRQDPDIKLSSSMESSPESIVTSKIEKLVLLEDMETLLEPPDIKLFVSCLLDVIFLNNSFRASLNRLQNSKI